MDPLFQKRKDIAENTYVAAEFLPLSKDQSQRHGAWRLEGATPHFHRLALTYLNTNPTAHARHLDDKAAALQILSELRFKAAALDLTRIHVGAALSTLRHREVSSLSRMNQTFFVDTYDDHRIILLKIHRGGAEPTSAAMDLLTLWHREVGELEAWSELVRGPRRKGRPTWKARVKLKRAANLTNASLWIFQEVIATGTTTLTTLMRQLLRCSGNPDQIVIAGLNGCREGLQTIRDGLPPEILTKTIFLVGMLHGGLDPETGKLINPGVGDPSAIHARLPDRVDRSNGESKPR